jgi:hypothetical protein
MEEIIKRKKNDERWTSKYIKKTIEKLKRKKRIKKGEERSSGCMVLIVL